MPSAVDKALMRPQSSGRLGAECAQTTVAEGAGKGHDEGGWGVGGSTAEGVMSSPGRHLPSEFHFPSSVVLCLQLPRLQHRLRAIRSCPTTDPAALRHELLFKKSCKMGTGLPAF